VNRSSAQLGNPSRAGLSQRETEARGPIDAQGVRITIPDRAFVERHLRTVRPECDQPESPDDDAAVRICAEQVKHRRSSLGGGSRSAPSAVPALGSGGAVKRAGACTTEVRGSNPLSSTSRSTRAPAVSSPQADQARR
jgi:hypothetical protein